MPKFSAKFNSSLLFRREATTNIFEKKVDVVVLDYIKIWPIYWVTVKWPEKKWKKKLLQHPLMQSLIIRFC